jgi:hypothetical protein
MRVGARLVALLLAAWIFAPAAQAQSAANGKVLYNTRFGTQNQGCYSCHGVQGSTLNNVNKIAMGANNPTVIQNAINGNTGGMGFLKPYLNSSQIADIAAYLGNPGLVGVGTPSAAVSPASLSFAATNMGSTSATQTVTLSNSGSAPLALASVASSNAAFVVSGGTCAAGGSVAAGGSCTVTVAFQPTSAGALGGTLTFTHNASPSTSTVALSGTGVALAPVASISPGALSFTQVVGATSATQAVTISNSGNAALVLSSLSLTGAQAAEFAMGAASTCSANGSVAPGGSCSVAISFTPAAAGSRSASLSVANNAGAALSVSLTGTGTSTPQPVVSLNQNALSFASQALGSTGAAQTVTVSNTGSASLQLSGLTLSGTNAGEFTLAGSCAAGLSLAPGASCGAAVGFSPAGLGTRSASLTIASNASNGSATVSLSGTGVPAPAPAVSLSPTAIDFGNVSLNGSVTRTVTLTNTGSASLQIASASVSGAGFTLVNHCAASVAAATTCTLDLSFSPGVAGPVNGVLTIASNAASSPNQLSLAGNGSAAPLPVLAWSGSTAAGFADTALGNTSAALSFTLSNQGPGTATLNAISLQGANPSDFVRGGSCAANASLAQGASCAVTLAFAPSQIGTRSAELDVSTSGTNPAPLTLQGNGVGTAQATLTLSVPSVSFPVTVVGTPPSPVPVTLTNAGTATLTVTAIGFDSPALSAQPSTQNGCAALPMTLAPGQQCGIDIVLDPSSPGDINATMTITSNASTPVQPLAVKASITGGSGTAALANAGAGGCSIARPGDGFDPLLLVLVAAAGGVLWLRRRQPLSTQETANDTFR